MHQASIFIKMRNYFWGVNNLIFYFSKLVLQTYWFSLGDFLFCCLLGLVTNEYHKSYLYHYTQFIQNTLLQYLDIALSNTFQTLNIIKSHTCCLKTPLILSNQDWSGLKTLLLWSNERTNISMKFTIPTEAKRQGSHLSELLIRSFGVEGQNSLWYQAAELEERVEGGRERKFLRNGN